jgi:hypothetical protein
LRFLSVFVRLQTDLKSFGASSRCAGSIPAPGITLLEPIDLKTDNQAI